MTQKHKKKTLNPEWNETFYLLVQEPKTQAVRLQVYDWDGIHLKVPLSLTPTMRRSPQSPLVIHLMLLKFSLKC